MASTLRTVSVLAIAGLLVVPLVVPAGGSVGTAGPLETVEADVWIDGPPETIDGTAVVRLEPYDAEPTTPEALEEHAAETQADVIEWVRQTEGVTIRNSFWLVNAVTLSVDPGTDIEPLAEKSDVEAIRDSVTVTRTAPQTHPIRETGSDDETTDPGSVTSGLSQIGAPAAWERFDASGDGVTVAVLDSGVEASHPDVDVSTFQEFDENGQQIETEPSDPSGQSHGTHVAGTVAGGAESGTAIGVAPEADLAVGGVLTDCGAFGCGGTFDQIVAGMQWAVEDAEADVLSMSLGVGGRSDRLVEPVRNARHTGTLVVAASGNAGQGDSGSPGNVYEAVGVGAVDDDGSVATFSGGEVIQREEWADPPAEWPEEYVVPAVTAPGVDVMSAQGSDGYGELSGTSMATPHVSGAAALVIEQHPDAEVAAVADALESTANKPPGAPGPPEERDTRYGAGIVDVEAAITEAEPQPEPPIPDETDDQTTDSIVSADALAAGFDTLRGGEDHTEVAVAIGRREATGQE
ncbi:MAG: S8 family serine peptidase [Natronomonas sp.]